MQIPLILGLTDEETVAQQFSQFPLALGLADPQPESFSQIPLILGVSNG